MVKIRDILHVGLYEEDPAAVAKYSEKVLGFPTTQEGPVRYLRTDAYHHRIAVHPGPTRGLAYAGWEVANEHDLEAAAKELESRGVAVTWGSNESVRIRKVARFFEVTDPSGFRVELACGPQRLNTPVAFTRPLNIVGPGHILLTVDDIDREVEFYRDLLAFKVSDYMELHPPLRAAFIRCNERHHTLALAPRSPAKAPRLQHFMFEVASLDDVMRTYHFAHSQVGMGPGRHGNCHTVHVYIQTPFGFAIEYGWGHRRIDDATHQVVTYSAHEAIDLWGGGPRETFELG